MAAQFKGDMTPVKSSAIEAVGYDPDRRAMVIRFTGGDSYLHSGVSPDQHAKLLGADSIGTHYGKHFRNQFSATKL
ncbi:KTSC domain-containing protein [Bradyrhizobium sp.]|uniref:KTSC domain-containing protein n=1 Tax=Bradyrhizobium sp. TaxID=376 RepID=UPI003C528321